MGPIGVFDSGYGGLTILDAFQRRLPQYDYLYLGDNARTPYGNRSFRVVYEYTLEAVRYLFSKGCPLVVLACNTASAKALRSIQQIDLPQIAPDRRVLGILRPTVEALDGLTRSRHVGLLGTGGTVQSGSYPIEISKSYPDIQVVSKACPMWVPLVECGEHHSPGADYFVQKYLDELFAQDDKIDTLILGCTHYPLLIDSIQKHVPSHVNVLTQGEWVARSLENYLHRHPEMDARCSRTGKTEYLTTEDSKKFEDMAYVFSRKRISVSQVRL